MSSRRTLNLDSPEALEQVEPQVLSIPTPEPNDVICGRGGESNNHVGNTKWRQLVSANKKLYISLPKREKMLVAMRIVREVRNLSPPGRFLQKNDETGLWDEIGDSRAKDKTSQALREGAPRIREVMIANGDITQKVKSEVEDWYRSCVSHSIARANQVKQMTQGGSVLSAAATEKVQSKLSFPPDMCPEAKSICILAGIEPESPQPDISAKLINFLIDYGGWVVAWKEKCDFFIDKMRVFYKSSYGIFPEVGLVSNSTKLSPPVPPTFPPEMPNDVRKFCIEKGIMPFQIDGLPSLAEIIRRDGTNLRSHQSTPSKSAPAVPIPPIQQSPNMMATLPTIPFLAQNAGIMPQMSLPQAVANSQQNLVVQMMLQQQLLAARSLANQHQLLFGGDISTAIPNNDQSLWMNQFSTNIFQGHGIDRVPPQNYSHIKNDNKRVGTGENYGVEEKKTRLLGDPSPDPAKNVYESSDRQKMGLEIPQTKLQYSLNSQQSGSVDESFITSAFKPNYKRILRDEIVIDDSRKTGKDEEASKLCRDNVCEPSRKFQDTGNRLFFQGIENEVEKATDRNSVYQTYRTTVQRNRKKDTELYPDVISSKE